MPMVTATQRAGITPLSENFPSTIQFGGFDPFHATRIHLSQSRIFENLYQTGVAGFQRVHRGSVFFDCQAEPLTCALFGALTRMCLKCSVALRGSMLALRSPNAGKLLCATWSVYSSHVRF